MKFFSQIAHGCGLPAGGVALPHMPLGWSVPSSAVCTIRSRAAAELRAAPLLHGGTASSRRLQMGSSSHSAAWTSLPPPRPEPAPAPGRGVCMMSTSWRDKQHPDLVNFIAAFLAANSYRLNFLSISPDFIINNGGLSVAFIFETSWDCENEAAVFSRVNTLKRQFKNLYVVVAVPTVEQIESFNQSYFRYDMELGCPTFVPVNDPEMGFEKMLKIAHARGVCKQQDISSTMKNEREQAVQCMDAFLQVVTSIPGIDNHDANMLAQAIGSIEAIAKAPKSLILESTDLSTDKAETVVRFFRDRQYYLSPKIN